MSLYTSEMCENDSQTGMSGRHLSVSPLFNQLIFFNSTCSSIPCTLRGIPYSKVQCGGSRIMGVKHSRGQGELPVTTLHFLQVSSRVLYGSLLYINRLCSVAPFIKSFPWPHQVLWSFLFCFFICYSFSPPLFSLMFFHSIYHHLKLFHYFIR